MATKQNILLLAAAAILLLLPSGSPATAVKYCKKGRDYPVKVSGVEVVPDPVVRGEPATFKISASTDKNITAGKLVIDVAYFIFHVHSETHNFCDETSCPATGEFMLASQQTLPSFTPPGSYTLTMKLVGDSNEELTCISFGFSIGWSYSQSQRLTLAEWYTAILGGARPPEMSSKWFARHGGVPTNAAAVDCSGLVGLATPTWHA
ncbi:hypothetical protein C2845_PM01G24220 [Panicum miliaceum]|uniref:MD-2-related lipid-recognition domain-containing protein n=1 Tax=Panicum miliaceum TaxID=4540 RepID=A0A3L6TKN0_PANMI|nr:hypothetical protein C2845_PM01G24220 [Panicum miliaceum]